MSGLKKKIATWGATFALAGTVALGGTAATVATAQPAEAATVSSCKYVWGPILRSVKETCRINYNWFEEVVLSKRDGYYYRQCNYKGDVIYNCGKWRYIG